MPEKLAGQIWRINIPLENSPLKNLNAYLIRGRSRNLLVDTGYHADSCIAAMRSALQELRVDMRDTDIFLTHLHSDHCGMAGDIASPDSTVYMSPADDAHLQSSYAPDFWERSEKTYLAYGFTEDELAENRKGNPAIAYRQPEPLPHTPALDGQIIDLGGIWLTCLDTPGHTPGHMCLYDEERGILFAGDHIIYDITPNITSWSEMDDALGTYLDSLRRVQQMDIRMAYSAHRGALVSCAGRIEALLEHHQARLEDALRILKNSDGLTAYQTAAGMKWSIRARNWEEFPVVQKFFAVGEAASHLDHLISLGMVSREKVGGKWIYRAR